MLGHIKKLFTGRGRAPHHELGHPNPHLSRDPLDDEMGLEELFEEYAEHDEVPMRMLRMSRMFGLSKQQIAHPNTQGRMLVLRCNNCSMRGRCFRDRDHKWTSTPGFDKERCANIETYREIAKRDGNRAPIKHQMFRMPKFLGRS
jgi:hypothetical protein